jgi:UDP-N-acetylglucosamine 2-epimerase (non-hydrolysing)
MSDKIKILTVFGTRPEAIKISPVLECIKKYNASHKKLVIKSIICVTAQHRDMLDQVLELFDIMPDYDLNLMTPNQNLAVLTQKCLDGLYSVIQKAKPDWMLIQGDTTTVMAGALAAYYSNVKIGHIEAGLRTYDKYNPFPEEINRRIASCVADLHFAPTKDAQKNLLNEGIPSHKIYITGNTGIDALLTMRKKAKEIRWDAIADLKQYKNILNDDKKKIVLVTGHRRESFGVGFMNICKALKDLARKNEDITIVYPVHLNPNVNKPVMKVLGNIGNIILTKPLEYLPFVKLLDRSYFILTDSGGIQEEAPTLGKPVLVMRDATERPEAIRSGVAKLVGTKPQNIYIESLKLIRNKAFYEKMAKAVNPYGDGKAAARIINKIIEMKQASYNDQ